VDVALAYEGKQGKWKKKDLSKVKCFHYGELGHYATQHLRKKSKREASETKTALVRAKKEVETINVIQNGSNLACISKSSNAYESRIKLKCSWIRFQQCKCRINLSLDEVVRAS